MSGSNIFVMYADGNGNVTVSPRLGEGHVEPEHDTAANIAVLDGSGIVNGRMVANVRCDNCESWQGGSMDFTSSSGGWIYASLPGNPIDLTSLTAEIEEHQAHGAFTWNFSQAQGGSDVNPFVNSDDGSAVSPDTGSSSSGDDDGSGGNTVVTSSEDSEPSNMMVTAHGALASIAFLALFPSGAIFIRIPALSRFGGVWMHAAIQIIAYCTYIAAAGLGIYIAMKEDYLMEYHPIIGMVLLGVLFLQPFGGIAHHHLFKKHGGRTLISYLHIFLGRGAILLGILNGGFGLILADVNNMGYLAAYGVVAGVMGSAYLAAIIYGEIDRTKRLRQSHGHGRKETS